MINLAYAGLTEHLNHRNGWVVYHIFEPNIMYKFFAGPTRKKPTETETEIDDDGRDRIGLLPELGQVMTCRRGRSYGDLR